MLGVGTQHAYLAPAEPRQQRQPVEVVVLDLAAPGAPEGVLEERAQALDVELVGARVDHAEIVDPRQVAVLAFDPRRVLLDDLDPMRSSIGRLSDSATGVSAW